MSETLVTLIVIFVLAMFVGFEVITKVPSLLHTPLMSGSNAISGITIIGAMVVAGWGATKLAAILGVVAVAMAMINVVGGYFVTDRMLQMFQRKPGEEAKKDKKEKGEKKEEKAEKDKESDKPEKGENAGKPEKSEEKK